MHHGHAITAGQPFPPIELPSGETVKAAHPEWAAHREKWRWLLDSYEGGDAYRFAAYELPAGVGVLPPSRSRGVPNLIPHKRELEDADGGMSVPNDDYALRLLRTPVPEFVSEAVDKHLGKIFNQAIRREGPDALMGWWEDVDGAGSPIDHVMSSSIAPLLMVLGSLDIVIDRPPVPEGEAVKTKADEIRLGLDKPVLSHVLPQNTLWWKLDARGGYAEVLIREPGDDGGATYVYWNDKLWARYDANGKKLAGPRGGDKHSYGRVPVFRAFDDPKRPRCRNVAMARYESLAELQREYYNRDSELILSDTTQAHPLVQGPEDYVKADGSIPVGPNWLLPKKKNSAGGAASYEGFEYLDPPKGAAESIRANKDDLRDAADRAACLTKPAGASGSDVTGQSGVSKRLDQSEGNERLGEIAAVLQRCERRIAEMAAAVMGVDAAPESVRVEYPRKFDLFSAGEFMEFAERLTGLTAVVGNLPLVDAALLSRGARACLPGLDDSEYEAFDAEIEAYVKARAEAGNDGPPADDPPLFGRFEPRRPTPPGDIEDDDDIDPDTEDDI